MTTTSYLNPHLTQEWNDWLNTNISNGVEITTLAKTLEQHGYHIAVGDLLKNYQIDIKHPQIDLSKNFIDNIKIVVPPSEFIEKLNLAAIVEQMTLNTKEITLLEELQATVLAQLSSR